MTSIVGKAIDRHTAMRRDRVDLMLRKAAASSGVAGTLGDGIGNPFAGMQDQSAQRQGLAQFRGWVYAAVNALASEAAGQPVHVGRMVGVEEQEELRGTKGHKFVAQHNLPHQFRTKAAKTELEVIDGHPLLAVLDAPNPIQRRWQFVYSFVANLCLTGWSYIVADTGKTGNIEFYSLPTSWVEPDHKEGAFTRFRIVSPNNPAASANSPPLTRDQVAFAYLPNPADPLSATSPTRAQSLAIHVDGAIQTTQAKFFDNIFSPSVIVTMGKNPHPQVSGGVRPRLSPAQRRQVYAAIRKVGLGIANYGNPAIIDGMIESIEKMTATQNEIGWEKSEKVIRSRILSGYGVHPFILGEEAPGSYSQMAIVQDRFFRRVNVILAMLGDAMTEFAPHYVSSPKAAKAKEKKGKILIWWDPCRAVDPSMEKAMWEGARGRDDVSPNEFRAYMDLPADETKDPAVINKGILPQVLQVAMQASQGGIQTEQAVAILTGAGIPEDLAVQIAGSGPATAEGEELPAIEEEEDEEEATIEEDEDEDGEAEDVGADFSNVEEGEMFPMKGFEYSGSLV